MIKGLYKFAEKWSEKGGVWLYSDPHFGDEELRQGIKNRPADDELLKLINSKVGKYDTFVCLGDVGNIEWAKKIRGYKVLICGNHDAGGTNYQDVFDEIYTGPLMISEKIILSHEPISLNWAFNIHGHTHELTKDKKGQKCVCADVIGYIPISLTDLIKSGRIKEIETIHRQTIDTATERKKKRNN